MNTVLIITNSFPPVRHSGTIRVESLCKHLPKFGFRPVVLTNKSGRLKLNPGLYQEALATVIRVDWARGLPTRHYRASRFPVAYSVLKRRRRQTLVRDAIRALDALPQQLRPKVIFASCPRGDALVVGRGVSAYFDIPLVADYRDPWSFWPVPLYPHYIDFLIERRIESDVVHKCHKIIVTTKASGRLLCNEFHVPQDRVEVIPNGYDEDEFIEATKYLPQSTEKFTIVHAGEIQRSGAISIWPTVMRRCGFGFDPLATNYDARSLRYFLAGLHLLLDRRPELADCLQISVVGADRLENDIAVRNFRYPTVLQLVPRVSSREAVGACLRANLLLLLQLETFYRGQPFCVFIPGKLYTYLRTGRRILACAQESEISQLISEWNAGTTVAASDPIAIANAIEAEFNRWQPPDVHVAKRPDGIERFERAEVAKAVANVLKSCIGEERSMSQRQRLDLPNKF